VTPAAKEIDTRTIADFGGQWCANPEVDGFYGSQALFADIVEPLVKVGEFAGMRVADIGSGAGRIVNMLLDAGAAHVYAVEPSKSAEVVRRNTHDRADRVTVFNVIGDKLPPDLDLDIVVSIGVLHHIVDPLPTVRAAYQALKPGGRVLVWLYGHEGNEMYLAIFGTLRALSKRLPDPVLNGLCRLLLPAADLYTWLCRFLPLPLRDYVLRVFANFSRDQRRVNIYDQLNPTYARYYRRAEALALLENAGFTECRLHHRHGYSWTVVGTKPG